MSNSPIPLFKVFMADTAADEARRVLHSGYIGEGEDVVAFEGDLAAFLGTERILATNAGTSALHLAYHMAIDHDPDAEIITTPVTCTATNTPIVQNGARIVWADVDRESGNIDPAEVAALITPRTRAIVAVHWGGNPGDIERLNQIGVKQGIPVIEDAAHALGASQNGRVIGQDSDYVAFSFQAIKHVTAVDGGALVTKTDRDYRRGRLLRWYGIDRTVREGIDLRCELDVEEAGYKFHMNNVAAAIGRQNLKHLPWILDRHRANAAYYDATFASSGTIRLSQTRSGSASAYWLYTLHLNNRDEVMQNLLRLGIGASKVHSRNDTHSMFAAFQRPLPNAASFERTHLCIPVGWWITESDRDRVAEAVTRYAR